MPTRRQFLKSTAAAVAATAYTPNALSAGFDPSSWASVRDQFLLDDGVTNLTTFLLASHPKPVRDAIDRHRAGLDRDAKRYLDDQEETAEKRARAGPAAYLEVDADEVALPASTPMAFALVYAALRLRPGPEVLPTV